MLPLKYYTIGSMCCMLRLRIVSRLSNLDFKELLYSLFDDRYVFCSSYMGFLSAHMVVVFVNRIFYFVEPMLGDLGLKVSLRYQFFFAVHALNKLPYSKLDSKSVGVREGVVFMTYSSLIASSEKGRSRLQQLVQWCGPEYDGLLIFDEVLAMFSRERNELT